MYLKDLIGKFVVRTGSPEYLITPDYSYTEMKEKIEVFKIIDEIPLIRIYTSDNSNWKIMPIESLYDDDKWKDVTGVWECMESFK